MSVQIHWETLNNDFVASFLTNTINYLIMQNKHLLLGGFAFIEHLELGETPPSFEFLSIDTMTDQEIVGEVAFAYNSDLLVKAQAYAPINPLQSTSRFAKRSRLHMNVAQSAAPGYINAWACVRDVHVEGKAKISYRALSPSDQHQYKITELMKIMNESEDYITKLLNHNEQNLVENDEIREKIEAIKTPKGMLTITLNSFPLKQVKVSFTFDGSVLADMVGSMINLNLDKAKSILEQQSYTFTLPI